MKRVAILGADFAPSSLPPALRIRYFAQHLPEFGWQPVIITTDSKHYNWKVDPENERLLPESLEVIRTDALPEKLTRKIGVGDIGARSMWYHWKVLSDLCRKKEIDLLFIPVPPYFPIVLGRLAHSRFGIPYIIDYIDPYVTEYYWSVPKEDRPPKWVMSYALSRILEPFSLKKVSHIVGVSKGTTDGVINRYSWLKESDGTEIPYGGETADFEYVRNNPRENKIFNSDDGLIHISYVGRGGTDLLPALKAIFQAVESGLDQWPELFSKVRLHFVGTSYAPDAGSQYAVLPLANEFKLQGIVDEHPQRVSYLDAIQILLDSHALLIVGSVEPHYTASKIFPNILAKKPLLAMFHEESSVVKILQDTNGGKVLTFNKERLPSERVDEIVEHLKEILLLPKGYQPSTRWAAFEQYTTRAMACRLASAFNKALS